MWSGKSKKQRREEAAIKKAAQARARERTQRNLKKKKHKATPQQVSRARAKVQPVGGAAAGDKSKSKSKSISPAVKLSEGLTLVKPVAHQLVHESLHPRTFYSNTRESEEKFVDVIDVLEVSVEDGFNSDFDLLQQCGLFAAFTKIMRHKHNDYRLGGGAGMVRLQGICDREKRLLALVQKISRRAKLAENLGIAYTFVDALIERIQAMVASLRQYASATLKDSIVVGLSTAVLDDPLRKNKGTTDSSGKANGDGDLAGDARTITKT